MPYIVVDLQGQARAGGYLKVDGGSQIALSDDMIIEVDPGTHYLEFSSQSSVQRGLSKLNVAVGNYNTAAWAERNSVDGNITERFSDNSLMLFTVVSDHAGHILGQPTYTIEELSDEKYQELTDMYNARMAAQAEAEAQAKVEVDATVGIELLVCLFLGTLGGHKFYRRQFGMGLLYLFTFGLFGIGWIVDTVKLLFKFFRSKT